MEFYFILVEPAVPGNIGAAARALKTTGHQHLLLVNPTHHFNDEAKMLGHGSWDILEKANIFSSFEEAIHTMDFVIGTSAKNRSIKYDYFPMEQLQEILNIKNKSIQRIAVVFGREESGLTNQELHECDLITYVSIATSYPSLNLAQAVMLYAYYLSKLQVDLSQNEQQVRSIDYKTVKSKSSSALDKLAINADSALHNRIMERIAMLGDDDLRLVLSVCNRINEITNE